MLVVRPQPGQALTIGVNARSPMVWRISCATWTSRVLNLKDGLILSDQRQAPVAPIAPAPAAAHPVEVVP